MADSPASGVLPQLEELLLKLHAIQAARKSRLRAELTLVGDWCCDNSSAKPSLGLKFWISMANDATRTGFPEARLPQTPLPDPTATTTALIETPRITGQG